MLTRMSLTITALSVALMVAPVAFGQAAHRAVVAGYVDAKDWVGLRGYLRANPALLSDARVDGPELRRFLEASTGLYSALTFSQERFPMLGVKSFEQAARPLPRAMRITDIVDVAKQDVEAPVAHKVVKKVVKKAVRKVRHAPKVVAPAVSVAVAKEAPAAVVRPAGIMLSDTVYNTLSVNGTRKIKASSLRLYARVKQDNNR